ncbi:MAG: hypothetical protein ABFE07_01340 [Armatimonadia bacterium]
MHSKADRLLILLLFLCLAVITEHWQHRVGYLFSQPPMAQGPAIIRGYLGTWHSWATRQPPPSRITETTASECAPNVYRVLMPAIYAGLAASRDATLAHSLLLLLLTFLLYVVLYQLGRTWFAPPLALGFVLLGIAINLNTWAVDPTGIMQGILVAACVLALVRRSALLYPAFFLLMANREDGVIIIAFAAILMLLDPTRRRQLLPVLGGLAAIAIAYEVGAHLWVGPRPRYCEVMRLHENLQDPYYMLRTGNIHHPIALFFATFVPLVAAAIVGWRGKSPLVRSLALAGLAYLVVTYVFACAREPHRNWQVIVMLLPAAWWTLACRPPSSQASDGACECHGDPSELAQP